jgi:hypothetical protein
MGLDTSYDNDYLKPTPYNLQQIMYMTATIQWNISINIKMCKQTGINGEKQSNNETLYLLVNQYQENRRIAIHLEHS